MMSLAAPSVSVAEIPAAVAVRANLPGPSRRIVVEPVREPAEPSREPEPCPAGEPVPAR